MCHASLSVCARARYAYASVPGALVVGLRVALFCWFVAALGGARAASRRAVSDVRAFVVCGLRLSWHAGMAGENIVGALWIFGGAYLLALPLLAFAT